MNKSIKYILLVSVFIILVISATISKLIIVYDENGDFEYYNNYSEIYFSNVIIYNNDDSSVKIDNKNSFLHIQIPNLADEYTFSVDLKNIGNSKTLVKNYSFSNIDSNLNINNIEFISSIKEGEYINGSESKKLIIKVKNKEKNHQNSYCNFNINYIFE